ncbi:MAG: UxaA family hydrolase [Burkholderiaceae bacterium]
MAAPSTPAEPLLLLSATDNVLVARRTLRVGETVCIDGVESVLAEAIALGHKLSRRRIEAGEPVLKYGAPIGVATEAIEPARHVHVHNLRSDYTPSYVLPQTSAGADT